MNDFICIVYELRIIFTAPKNGSVQNPCKNANMSKYNHRGHGVHRGFSFSVLSENSVVYM